ncbi:glutaredoxin-like protein C5orf63 homolog [Anneissia japonica]|uniref:glutaredoxin-like protein C5orf63 homolog n=1 Tax=Anneissia japonica TaxID=1529436 RepID=UPI001425B048|nr:glutaredoxin-like protein C5orf63 homolog [Anneissia japonica]
MWRISTFTSTFIKQAIFKEMIGPGALLNINFSHKSSSLPLLTLYTKDDCSLCETAMAVVNKYKHRFKFEEVDIEAKGNKIWFEKYRYDIPVFHLNGQFLMKHRADEKLFVKSLELYEQGKPT